MRAGSSAKAEEEETLGFLLISSGPLPGGADTCQPRGSAGVKYGKWGLGGNLRTSTVLHGGTLQPPALSVLYARDTWSPQPKSCTE